MRKVGRSRLRRSLFEDKGRYWERSVPSPNVNNKVSTSLAKFSSHYSVEIPRGHEGRAAEGRPLRRLKLPQEMLVFISRAHEHSSTWRDPTMCPLDGTAMHGRRAHGLLASLPPAPSPSDRFSRLLHCVCHSRSPCPSTAYRICVTMGRDYWSRIWLAYGTYAYAVELFVAAQLYNDFFQGPLAALSIIHLRQATGTLDGGVACRVPCELWAMLREAVQDEARAMLRTAIHDLTVASTCDGCRPQLPSGAILRWADHPSDGGQSKFVWKGCSRCEEKARQMTGHIYRLVRRLQQELFLRLSDNSFHRTSSHSWTATT